MITAYIVNENRTKILLRYNERTEDWHPLRANLSDSENLVDGLKRRAHRETGLTVIPISPYDADILEEAYILEANEDPASKYDLEEQYDAQWLTKDEILACTCVYGPVKGFARLLA